MHRLAEAIEASGRSATLIQDSKDFHPGWFSSCVNTISHHDWLHLRDNSLSPLNNVVIFPETYITSVSEYSANLPAVIFNQNAAYTFGLNPQKSFLKPSSVFSLYRQPCIKHVLCVSHYDYAFLSEYICPDSNNVSLIVNGLEDSISYGPGPKSKRILYMPRKNLCDATVVSSLISATSTLGSWEVSPVDSLPHSNVIDLLRSSLLFLSFGHPEGFGLPVAEALGCGCAVIGYSGLGGRELFEIAGRYQMAHEVLLGDWSGFMQAIKDFDASYCHHPDEVLSRLQDVSCDVVATYNFKAMIDSVGVAMSKIENSL